MAAIHPLHQASRRKVTLTPDLCGRPVLGAEGEEIGHIADVWVEERGEERGQVIPRYLEVVSGGVFHLGERKALLPWDEVTIQADGVHIRASITDLFGRADAPPLKRPRGQKQRVGVISSDTTLEEAARQMKEQNVRELAVYDGPKRMGTLTAQAIADSASKTLAVRDVMVRDAEYYADERDAREAARHLEEQRLSHLASLDRID